MLEDGKGTSFRHWKTIFNFTVRKRLSRDTVTAAADDATITSFPFGCGREEFLGFNTKMLCRLVFSENVEEERLLSNLVFSFNLLPLRNPKRKQAITNSFLGSLSAMRVFTLYLKNCRNKHHLLPNTLSKIKVSKTSEPGFTKKKKKKASQKFKSLQLQSYLPLTIDQHIIICILKMEIKKNRSWVIHSGLIKPPWTFLILMENQKRPKKSCVLLSSLIFY